MEEHYDKLRTRVLGDLEKTFRPEFLNRVDKIVVYRPLGMSTVEQIVDLQIAELQERLKQQKLKLKLSPKARTKIAELVFSPNYGARAVGRIIQEQVENVLAGMLLSNQVKSGQMVKIGLVKDKIVLERLVNGAK